MVSEQEEAYYIRRSQGVGMVITACVYVNEGGKGFHGEFGADRDELLPSLRKLAEAIKGQGAKAILQIFHGGRQCPPVLLPDGQTVSASAVPAELPANTYLIQQFFSPHSNIRDDCWGGSLEKRLTFPLAVVDAVKHAVSEHADSSLLVGYRFSPEEPETPGITMAETFALIDALKEKDLDYLHVSLQDFWALPRRGTEDPRPRIEQILDRVAGKVPVIGVGSLYSADDALKALETGIALVALGRPLLIDPDWVQKVEQGNEEEIQTELDPSAQSDLVIPDPLWGALIHTPGWLPIKG
ncbi:NADH-dependent flavin oxidoreductase [Paenibacillus sp. BR2-3]|uniref:NADH-dependent flavin oxidoreductase n=1 Tax=Paenibacillus sp. BR2-3 TaxID=3048494 RepID=UPI003977591D